MKREAKSYGAFAHEDIAAGLKERISSGPRLKRIIGLVSCFKKKLHECIRRNRSAKELDHTKEHSVPLDLERIKMAKKEIIRSVQRRHFGEEFISLGKEKCLKSCRCIVKLNLFTDDDTILRVGGRTQIC